MLLDMLNRPIAVGDTVLVKDYCSTSYVMATIDKIARVNVYVTFSNKYQWIWNAETQRYASYKGDKRMARNPTEVIVVNEQLAYNKNTWPELGI